MRKRIQTAGIETLEPHEVLEYMLYAFVPRKDTNPIAHKLIDKFGSLSQVFDADIESLMQVDGISEVSATFIHSMRGIMTSYQLDKAKSKIKLDTLANTVEYVSGFLAYENKEKVYVLMLNAQSQLIKLELLNKGTIDQVGVYTREIAEMAIRYGAVNVIICHNHPSGNVSPSLQDITMTRGIYTALKMINIKLLDHIIISGKSYYSMKFSGDLHEIIDNVEQKFGEGFFENQTEWREK